MRIAFVGKGGSGKTTLSALFSRYLGSLGKEVIAIDADINQHLGDSLGFGSEELSCLATLDSKSSEISRFIRGSNSRIYSDELVTKTTPPGTGSGILSFSSPLLYEISVRKGNIRLLATGAFTEEDIGLNCYHGKTTIVETLLNHFADCANEYLIVDMTAGADWFSSGMFTKFDRTFLVVEPTKKSCDIYAQFKKHADPFGITIDIIANKIDAPEDVAYIRDTTGTAPSAVLWRSEFVKYDEREGKRDIADLEEANLGSLSSMKSLVDGTPQDRDRMYRLAVEFHRKNSENWLNKLTGKDMTLQIDESFDTKALYGGT